MSSRWLTAALAVNYTSGSIHDPLKQYHAAERPSGDTFPCKLNYAHGLLSSSTAVCFVLCIGRAAAGYTVRRKKDPLNKYHYFRYSSIYFYKIFRSHSWHNL